MIYNPILTTEIPLMANEPPLDGRLNVVKLVSVGFLDLQTFYKQNKISQSKNVNCYYTELKVDQSL
jgi:hypothetical protein